jgi:hypothetical protein
MDHLASGLVLLMSMMDVEDGWRSVVESMSVVVASHHRQ